MTVELVFQILPPYTVHRHAATLWLGVCACTQGPACVRVYRRVASFTLSCVVRVAALGSEAASLVSFSARAASVTSLSDVHQWVFVEHGAYSSSRHKVESSDAPVSAVDAVALASY